MDTAHFLFWLGAAGAGSVLCGYPALLWVRSRLRGRAPAPTPEEREPPRVTLLVAVRNGEGLVPEKVANTLALDYPADRLDLIVSSDGSTDRTVAAARAAAGGDPRVRVLETKEHRGKATAINAAAARAEGDVLVFSDVDGMLEPDALRRLLAPLSDPGVGGVCGARGIGRDRVSLGGAQGRYISLDSRVKELESVGGSITSNDGKLYALRRALFRPIPDGVTDDLYAALNVVDLGARFVFEPSARVSIRVPSRSPGHELDRRRRIVARSLRGLWLMRRVLDPRRCGFFSLGLFVNKVLRRLLPVFLLSALTGALLLAPRSPVFLAIGVGALAFAALAALGGSGAARRLPAPLAGGSSLAFYFVLGNWGTLLGVMDFLRNRTVVRWDPKKGDGEPEGA